MGCRGKGMQRLRSQVGCRGKGMQRLRSWWGVGVKGCGARGYVV